jgi:hypothetical protein
MKTTDRFGRNIAGTLNCFDRIVLFGTFKPICHPKAMGFELFEAGFRLLDYEKKIRQHIAPANQRPHQRANRPA